MNINHGVRNSKYRQSEAVDEAAWHHAAKKDSMINEH
jgi:hypothetical protein